MKSKWFKHLAALALLLAGLTLQSSCAETMSVEGRRCPCAAGWICCERYSTCIQPHEPCPSRSLQDQEEEEEEEREREREDSQVKREPDGGIRKKPDMGLADDASFPNWPKKGDLSLPDYTTRRPANDGWR